MTSLLIIKNNVAEIKKVCDQKGINYEIYTTPLDYSQLHDEKIKMFSDYNQVLEDKELEEEKAKLELADESEEYDEYEQEE